MKDSNRTKEDIYRKFQNPAKEYRGTPFWSWNAEMTPEEVRRQEESFMGRESEDSYSLPGWSGDSLSGQRMDGLRGGGGG